MLYFMNTKQTPEPGRSLLNIVIRLIIISLAICLWLTASLAAAQQAQQEEFSPLIEKWLGDFDGMAERREIRVLVVYSKTFYFLDQGRQRGST